MSIVHSAYCLDRLCLVTMRAKAVWRIGEREYDIELKCTPAMIEQVSVLKKQYLQSLVDNLERRLSSHTPDAEVLEALTELASPKSINDFNTDDENSQEKLSALIHTVCAWYGEKETCPNPHSNNNLQQHNAILNKRELQNDMFKVLSLVKECYSKLEICDFFQHIITQHADDLPQYTQLCYILMCIPVTSVECERAFSMQNRIKTKLRNRLGEDRLNRIMTINTGPSVDLFDFVVAVAYATGGLLRKED